VAATRGPGLLMAAQAALSGSHFRVDCQAVQVGAQKGADWAMAPDRQLARAWGPLASALEDGSEHVDWKPAHCTEKDIAAKRLSNDEKLSFTDWRTNALVDSLAKSAAQADRIPQPQRRLVQETRNRVTSIATWIASATVLANDFPDPRSNTKGRRTCIRDNEEHRPQRARGRNEKIPIAPAAANRQALYGFVRWEALRERVRAKQAAAGDQASARNAGVTS
jgi:hypothetical protein